MMKINKKIIFVSRKKIKYKKNPLKFLKKNREVVKISDGLFQFQGEFLKVFRALNNYFYNLAIKKFDAIDQENPILWPIDLYNKIDYFSDFPQQVLMVSGLKKNYKNINNFTKRFGKKNLKKIDLKKNFRGSVIGLQPAVCDNCYYALKNMKNFKNTTYTTYNKVFRDEKSNVDNLDRLLSFSVRDMMFVGEKEFVIKQKSKIIKYLKFFLLSTGLNCTIEKANDPFFSVNKEKKVFQDALDLKYEILVDIPFLKKKIAVGSINYHYNTFGKAFNIKNEGKTIFSACIGIGFERLVLALYSQFGINTNLWPKELKKIIKI